MVQDRDWIVSLGDTFATQYSLYVDDDEHTALLHRSSVCPSLSIICVHSTLFLFYIFFFIIFTPADA